VKLLVWTVTREALTETVMAELPAVVGVPEIRPAVLRARPAGKVPEVRVKVLSSVPPVAPTVSEYAESTVAARPADGVAIARAGEPRTRLPIGVTPFAVNADPEQFETPVTALSCTVELCSDAQLAFSTQA
jgi:hypothetical protein